MKIAEKSFKQRDIMVVYLAELEKAPFFGGFIRMISRVNERWLQKLFLFKNLGSIDGIQKSSCSVSYDF